MQYTLPDGSTLNVSSGRAGEGGDAGTGGGGTNFSSCPKVGPARFRAPELLFQPDLIGDESEGLHEVLVFAIHKSDMDLRRTLFANIMLSGGSTLFKGT